ncbi:MAG TPA: MFS transporter [Alphaproteobacteria bacterium]|nr:MFS transporter [Alphaproteobacteria bacterium]
MKKNYQATIAAMAGNALEYYDVMLFGFFATMLAPLFFPADNQFVSIVASLGTFAAGFVMRPVGGMVFGHLGDKYGRRYALVLAIFLVTLPTLTIGLLPTYAEIGIAAPIILVVCRLLQGLCVGGEYSGASIFVIEYSKRGKESFAGSILTASGHFGGVLGTLCGFVCTLSFMPGWGWRIPFLMGSLMGLMGYYIRSKVNESPDFIRAKEERIEKIPLWGVLQKRKRNLFCTVGIGATSLIPLYMATVYMGFLLSTKLQIPTSQIMLMNTAFSILNIILFPFMGRIADKIGKEKMMISSAAVSFLIAYPLFSLLERDLSVLNVFFVQIILGTVNVAFAAPIMALLTRYFPVHERYSGIGVGYALGGALLGGTTPLIIATLTNWLDSPLIPAYYLMFSGILGMSCVIWGRKVDHAETVSDQTYDLSPMYSKG